jgi:site-specific recombinase XerC
LGKRLPKTMDMDVDQITMLIEHIVTKDPIGIREKAIIEFFYSSGLRFAELAGCNINDIRFDSKIIQERVKIG